MGYTRVDNWLFDVVLPNVDAAAFKVISVVVRKTIGWNKQADTISITQFQELCGFSGRSMTQRAVDIAIESGYLIRVSKGRGFEYIVPDSGTMNEGDRTRIRYDDVPESGTPIVPESGNTKERKQKVKGEAPAAYVNGDGPLLELEGHFTTETGIMPGLGVFDEKWKKPLEIILERAGGMEAAKQRITGAVDFARNGDKRYTISSPASLLTIISNMPEGGKPGPVKVRTR